MSDADGDARPWFVYLARCADGSYYCGATTDVTRRLRAHNAGRGARYTRGRRPVELAYVESASTRGDALRREAAIKRLPRAGKERLVRGGREAGELSATAPQP